MRYYTSSTTDELYERMIALAHEASGFDLDEQDIYIEEMRVILNEISTRVYDAICEAE